MATVADCAAHLFITERAFYERLSDGTIDRQPANGYDLDIVREQYIEHLRGVAAGRYSLCVIVTPLSRDFGSGTNARITSVASRVGLNRSLEKLSASFCVGCTNRIEAGSWWMK